MDSTLLEIYYVSRFYVKGKGKVSKEERFGDIVFTLFYLIPSLLLRE